jgi:hypothetical protein
MLTSVELAVLVAFLSFLIFRQLTRLRSRAGQVEQPSAAGIPYRAERGHGVQPTFRQPLGSRTTSARSRWGAAHLRKLERFVGKPAADS